MERVKKIKQNCKYCGHNKLFIKTGKIIEGLFCTKCKEKQK